MQERVCKAQRGEMNKKICVKCGNPMGNSLHTGKHGYDIHTHCEKEERDEE